MAKGFSTKTCLPAFSAFTTSSACSIMAGENGNGVDVWVVDDLVIIGSGIFEAKFFA